MVRSTFRCKGVAAAAIVSLGLVAGGCANKQLRQEGALAPPAAAEEAEQPGPKAAESRPAAPPQAEPKGYATTTPPETAPPGALEEVDPQAAARAARAAAGLQRIHFDFDQAGLTRDARGILLQNMAFLSAHPGAQIRIEGHCDERGTTEYNLALGERRARSAYDYLMDLGVASSRMTVVSYGEEVPLAHGTDEAAWAKNRRAEFLQLEN